MSSVAPSRPHASIVVTASAGSPAPASASRITSTRISFELRAAEPPRRIAALPLLTARTAASTVTLGRAS